MDTIHTISNNTLVNCYLQLAANGKIYLTGVGGSTSLDVINNPNSLGAACGYSVQGQSVAPKTVTGSLPNFMGSYFMQHPIPTPYTYTVSNNYGCQAAQFNSTYLPCAGAGYSLTGLQWNFGDPASGSANTSTLVSPIHAFTNLGTYSVNLVLYYSCGGGTDTIKQVVNINQPCISVNSTSITCTSLGSATVTTAGGIGPFNYTWMPSNQTSSVATALSPGTYTINVFDFGNNFTYTATTVFTSLIPLTGTVNYAGSVTCNGASSATANVSNIAGGSGNEYYLWQNSTTSYTNATPLLTGGLWSVTVTDALTGCQINDVFYISQPPPLNLVLSSSSPTTCEGTSVTVSGLSSGGTPCLIGSGYTYTWNSGPVSSLQVVSQPTAGTAVYTLSSRDSLNCLITNTIGVNFIANPVLSVSNVSICPLQTGTLSVSGATSYTWSSTTLSLTGITWTDSPMTNTQYTVLGAALGCTSTATASIILKPTPFPTLIDNSPVCEGTSLTLSAYGGASYVWQGANGFISTNQFPIINPVTLNDAGAYSFTVSGVNSCTASTTKTMVVNPIPTLSATGATICTSQTLNLIANSTATAFLWNGPQSFTSSLQNPSITNPVLAHTGTYSIHVTSAFGCTNNAITSASVVPPPSLTSQLSSHSLCSQAFNGSPNTITLTAGGAIIYSLVTVPDMSISNPNGPVSQLSAIPPNTGIASATLSGSNGVCTVTTGLTFSIIPNPTVTISSPTPVICAGETYTYTNQGASSYTWSSATPGFTSYNNGGVAVANPSINSVFSVFGGSLGCNSASQTSSITVKPLPIVNLGPETPTVCIGSKVVLNAGGSANSFTWAPFASINSMNGNTVNAFPTSQQTYTVIGSLNSCTSTAMITVSVLSLPSPTIRVLNPKVCINETITMQGFGGEYYKWNGPNAISYEGQTIRFKAGSPFYAGAYTLTATDENGCQAKANTDITLYNLPSGTLEGKMNGCVPLYSEFIFQSTPDIDVVWELNQKTIATKNFSTDFLIPGTYTILGRYTDTLTHCKNTGSFVVNAYAMPIADFSYLPEKPIENFDEVIFTNTSKGEEQKEWNWYFINNATKITKQQNATYLFKDAGVYPVAMVVTNTWGCADTMVKAITIEPDFNIFVPNAFTPNDDYKNQIFLPVCTGVKFYELNVFNRWGKRIFQSMDLDNGWDGTYNGEPCQDGVYVWQIKVSSINGEMKKLTGHVTLYR